MQALEGRFVRIRDLGSPLQANSETRQKCKEAEDHDFDGECGYCMSWDPDEAKYVVVTFSGLVAGVPPENLEEFQPINCPTGFFDVAWPDVTGQDPWEFANMVGHFLNTRGFCVVQMFAAPALRATALSAARAGAGAAPFEELRKESEAAYLGDGNVTDCSVLLGAGGEEEGGEPVPQDYEDALLCLDAALSQAASLLTPLPAQQLGFRPSEANGSRSAALMRTGTLFGAEDRGDGPPELSDADVEDAYVERFVSWVMRKKLCMMYFVENEGGVLELYPREDPKKGGARIRLQPSRMVLFRHDLMGYSYRPEGESLAVQAWIEEEPKAIEFRTFDKAPLVEFEEHDSVHVVSVHECFPANCDGCDMTFRAFLAGTDALTGVPYLRFDEELYCTPGDPTAPAFGKAYTMHGALIDHERFISFDNTFFRIEEEEAYAMSPAQRWVLETGYVCLNNGGWTRRSLSNARIGTFLGDSGSEWNGQSVGGFWGCYQKRDHYQAGNNNVAVTIGRLAHCMNMTGPCLTVDTACSASLVAANSACHFMRRYHSNPKGGEGATVPRERASRESLNHALCGGILAMVHPAGWIGECAGKMLSLRGRCFTWDASADGFIRGEGCCMAYLRSQDAADSAPSVRRLAALLGTAVTANGRGASLTAPSGPAQGAAMQKSMREGAIAPAEVIIGEVHGTATPLGDPIEIGAAKNVLKTHRDLCPYLHCTAKAHVGHEEANAGACALIKAVLMTNASCVTPNPGLITLNANIDVAGYPVQFCNELTATNFSDQICAVSSFGFGGSVAVCHVWGDADLGHRKEGNRIHLDREEALEWIDRVVKNAGTSRPIEGLSTGRKYGHGH